MSRNGSGTYTWPAGSFNPAVSGASATPGDWNTGRADLETAVSNSIASDGQTTVTANLPMATFKHTGVGNASNRTDYASAAQIADGTITYAIDTGTADLYAIAPTPTLTTYLVGQTFHFKVINANATTTPTLAVSGLATPGVIKWPNAAALVAGDLPANALVSVTVASISPAVFHLQTVAVPPARATNGTITTPAITGGTWSGGTLTTATITTATIGTAVTGVTQSASDNSTKIATTAYVDTRVLATYTNSLTGDVALNNIANYFTGPTVAQGTSGKWLASGTVSIQDSGTAANMFVKLWDGTTVIASGAVNTVLASAPMAISLSGVITNPAGNIRISVRDTTAITGLMTFNATGNSTDCTLTVVRIG